MKKIYNTPKLKVVMLNGADIIATSEYSVKSFAGNDEGDGAGE